MESNRRIKLLVFDLDGTLADTRLDLAHSVNISIASLGRKSLGVDVITTFIGDGAEELMRRSLTAAGFSEAEVKELLPSAMTFFMNHYTRHCLESTHAYDGAIRTLKRLPDYKKAVLTNKPVAPSERILERLGLRRHFELILGGDSPHGRKPSADGLKHIMSTLKCKPSETVLIGDGLQDLQTAKTVGCWSIAFLGGIGDAKALEAAGPTASVKNLDQIPPTLVDMEQHLQNEK